MKAKTIYLSDTYSCGPVKESLPDNPYRIGDVVFLSPRLTRLLSLQHDVPEKKLRMGSVIDVIDNYNLQISIDTNLLTFVGILYIFTTVHISEISSK